MTILNILKNDQDCESSLSNADVIENTVTGWIVTPNLFIEVLISISIQISCISRLTIAEIEGEEEGFGLDDF